MQKFVKLSCINKDLKKKKKMKTGIFMTIVIYSSLEDKMVAESFMTTCTIGVLVFFSRSVNMLHDSSPNPILIVLFDLSVSIQSNVKIPN